jgi:hypothetical protein
MEAQMLAAVLGYNAHGKPVRFYASNPDSATVRCREQRSRLISLTDK